MAKRDAEWQTTLEDSDPNKKAKRVLSGLACIAHEISLGTAYQYNGLPQAQKQRGGSGKKRKERAPRQPKAAVQQGKEWLSELNALLSKEQNGSTESPAARHTRFLHYCVSHAHSAGEAEKIKQLDSEAQERCALLCHVPPSSGIEHPTDFMTTLPPAADSSGDVRMPMKWDLSTTTTSTTTTTTSTTATTTIPRPTGAGTKSKPTTTTLPIGGCGAMPSVSAKHELTVSSCALYHVSRMSTVVEEREQGVAMLGHDSHIANVRLPASHELKGRQLTKWTSLVSKACQTLSDLERGEGVASVHKSFVVLGTKKEKFMNGANTHSHLKMDESTAAAYLHIMNEVRSFFRKFILPKVEAFLYIEMCVIKTFFRLKGVKLFYDVAGSCTIGALFWPRAHIDKDAFFSVLPVCDSGGGIIGGDFSFPSLGTVLKAYNGSIFIYDPTKIHGTTEMALERHSSATRYMASFYLKNEVISGVGASKYSAKNNTH